MPNYNSIGVMQPYIFPYYGYYKMIALADYFIIYDNVQYINRGYINRNKILINGKATYFNFQIEKQDLFQPIQNVRLKNFKNAKQKFIDQVYFSYKRAPFFDEVFNYLDRLFLNDFKYINKLNSKSLEDLSLLLNLNTDFFQASSLNINNFDLLSKEEKLDRFIDHFQAKTIIMPPNSLKLYANWSPKNNCHKLNLKMAEISYKQFSNEYVPNLSIIDVLMFNGFQNTSKLLTNT